MAKHRLVIIQNLTTLFIFLAVAIINEAERIKQDTEGLIDERSALITDIEVQLEVTSDLVERGWIEQQITTELLADTFTAEGKAKEARAKAEQTLSEALETLAILEGMYYRR